MFCNCQRFRASQWELRVKCECEWELVEWRSLLSRSRCNRVRLGKGVAYRACATTML